MKLFTQRTLISDVGAPMQSSSCLGFACASLTSAFGPDMTDEDALKILQGVYDMGCRHFDTAEGTASATNATNQS
jgi:hypothetical protein